MIAAARFPLRSDPANNQFFAPKSPWSDMVLGPIVVYGDGPVIEVARHSTVGRLLSRNGLNRLAYLEPPPPVIRYEYSQPGGLLHLDIKKLGRFNKPGHRVTRDRLKGRSYHVGWEYVHVAIDDNSRVAHSGLYADQSGRSACLALIRALRYYTSLGVCFERVMTDNGPCYKSGRFKRLCRRLGLKHILYQTLHATNEWQGRAIYPNRSARMGLHQKLRKLRPTWWVYTARSIAIPMTCSVRNSLVTRRRR